MTIEQLLEKRNGTDINLNAVCAAEIKRGVFFRGECICDCNCSSNGFSVFGEDNCDCGNCFCACN